MALSSRMPDLAALEVLLAVSRGGSLSSAAREVGTTQQAVSARIAAMEAQTGVPLVVRTPRGSELTDNGRLVAGWAERVMQVAGELDSGLASLRAGTRERVRVSASLTIAEQLMPGWLVSLQIESQRHGTRMPDVVLTAVNSEHVAQQVLAGEADLGFVEGPRAPHGLRSKIVARDELVLAVRPDHDWARRTRPVTAAELARTPLVTREAGSGTRTFLDAALAAALGSRYAPAAPALELSTAAAIRAAVLAGAGPAVISRLPVADDLAAGRLRTVKVRDIDLHRDLRAIWIGGRTPPAGAVRDLLSHIGAPPAR